MEKIQVLLLWFVPLLFSLSVHEYAHAWAADKLGDPTARYMGRLSLNPMAHADPIGTILFPLLAFFTNAPLFGWAKPVPVNLRNLKNPYRDGMLVAAAGPASNLVMAVGFTLFFGVLRKMAGDPMATAEGFSVVAPLTQMALIGIHLNVILAVFNMLPLPPLDGGRVAAGLFPRIRPQLAMLEQYGFVILILLFFTGAIKYLILVPAKLLFGLLLMLVI